VLVFLSLPHSRHAANPCDVGTWFISSCAYATKSNL
jgi:hypothetical protein